jgi:hypothetical protein
VVIGNWIDIVQGGQVVVTINNNPSMRASASPAFSNPSVNQSNCHYCLGILLLVLTASSVYTPITAISSSGYVISSIVATSTSAYKINSLFSLLIGVALSSPAFLTPLIPVSPSPGYVEQVITNSDSTYSFSTYSIGTISCTMNAHERKAIKRKERRLNPVNAEAAAVEDARRETANEQRRIRRAAARDRNDYTERDANTAAKLIRRAAAQSRNDKTEQEANTTRRRLVRKDADR